MAGRSRREKCLRIECRKCGELFPTYAGRRFCDACLADARSRGIVLTVCYKCGIVMESDRPVHYVCDNCRTLTRSIVSAPRAKRAPEGLSARKCHDCGKPTTQYRCEACWKKWRKKYRVEDTSEDDIRAVLNRSGVVSTKK